MKSHLGLKTTQVVGLVDEADKDVGDDVAGAGVEISSIRFIGRILFRAELADIQGFLGVLFPKWMTSHAQEIAVVFEQFFEAGAGDVGEFEFHFLGGAAGLAAFEDVLFPRAGSLHHLVGGAATLVHEAAAEAHGAIIDDAGFLEGEELLVAAVSGDESLLM